MKELKVGLSNILKISEMIKEKANSMFDECAPFNDSPCDTDEYIWLMGISAALDYQIEVVEHNLKFAQDRTQPIDALNNRN